MRIASFLRVDFLVPQTFVVVALVVADAVAAVVVVDVAVDAVEVAVHYYFAVVQAHFVQVKILHRDLLGNHQVQLEQVSIAPKR